MRIDYKRDLLVDLVRFIAIVSIVIGHAFNTDVFYSTGADTVRKFVYIYHIVAFFWCSGYVWKYKSIGSVLKTVVKKQYAKTTVVAMASLVIIPFWVWLGVMEHINREQLITKIFQIFTYHPSDGVLVGALWFMPFFTVSIIIFELIMRTIKKEKWRVVTCVVLGCIGIWFVNENLFSTYYLNFALLMQVVLLLGYFTKQYGKAIMERLSVWSCIVSAILIILLNAITGYQIELSKHDTYGAFFYIMVIVGLAFCISLAKVLQRTKCANVFAWIGQKSFEIMAIHFMMFKLFDGVVYKVGHKNTEIDLLAFPVSHESIGFRILYAVVGVVGSILVCKFIEIIKQKVMITNRGGEKA